jgi:type I restriction enzyme M protein
VLDRFKLSGVIATWWTETLPDLKTLLENGFPGVIDGWIDAIADALEDEDEAGPLFDPFAHKLVRATMVDYLEKMNAAKTEISRLKAEKEGFEQSNPPDDADEEELDKWNYAKDLEQQTRELKSEHGEELKQLRKLERAAAKRNATDVDRQALSNAQKQLEPIFKKLGELEATLEAYDKIKEDLSKARIHFKELAESFLQVLKGRCDAKADAEKQALVLELMAEDAQVGLEAAIAARRQEIVRSLENLWDKYRTTFEEISSERSILTDQMNDLLGKLGYK